ncbi:uncharacterized protein LOC143182818 [Calliopsis andreniformis]|uniref:uncharacterized protein LOC143182818 n=1 Tax=Calliopsis andreniformis TaxID=337506 RepID=UPI003FCE6A84
MSTVAGIIETEDIVGKPTLVGRVSNMLKDGSYSGPPILFRHASMQKIRHCCQNLNLLPYLLYSFDNSKSHPIARKVHLCFDQLLQIITARIFLLHKGFRQSLLYIRPDESKQEFTQDSCSPAPKFRTFNKQKRKQNHPLFLILAVYFAPLLLAFQLVGLFSLMVFGKYTPGFIFLISALLFLGCISLKIFFYESVTHLAKCERKKVQ